MSDTGCSPCQLHAAWIDAEKVGNVDRQLVGEVDELVVRLAVASIGILIDGPFGHDGAFANVGFLYGTHRDGLDSRPGG